MFHFTVETDKSVDEAVQAVEASLKERKFGVLWHFDLTGTLQSKGIDFTKPYRVLEVCNPVQAQRVLTQNSLVGYFLPCKIVVYEDDGKTKIGLPRPSVLMDTISDPQLRDIANEVEQTLIEAVEAAK